MHCQNDQIRANIIYRRVYLHIRLADSRSTDFPSDRVGSCKLVFRQQRDTVCWIRTGSAYMGRYIGTNTRSNTTLGCIRSYLQILNNFKKSLSSIHHVKISQTSLLVKYISKEIMIVLQNK